MPAVIDIFMPMNIKKVTIKNVFDLRQLETQQWLVEFLPEGDKVFSKMADKLSSFKEMILSLTCMITEAAILQTPPVHTCGLKVPMEWYFLPHAAM